MEKQIKQSSITKKFKHQELAEKWYKDAEYFGLLWDCGTGKTFGSFSIAELKDMPTIIIAPKGLCDQWREKLVEDFGVPEEDVFVYKTAKMKTKKKQAELDKFLEII